MSSGVHNIRQSEAQCHRSDSDEEDEELAALRQAALLSRKSIKKVNRSPVTTTTNANKPVLNHNKSLSYLDNHHPNNFRLGYNKPKWRQASNLIVINTVPLEEEGMKSNVPSFMLPEKRWCSIDKQNSTDQKSPKGPKKFSRIRSNSDSESDFEGSHSGTNSDADPKDDNQEAGNDPDDCGSLMLTEEEIDNSQESELALIENDLNLPIVEPIDNVATEAPVKYNHGDSNSEVVDRLPSGDSDDSRPNSELSRSGSSVVGDVETENTRYELKDFETDSDLGSCASIELEHAEFDDIDAELSDPIEKLEPVKKYSKITLSSDKSKSKEIRSNSEKARPRSEKSPVDLRLLLKAKRNEKTSSRRNPTKRRSKSPSPVVKSVLSIVKPANQAVKREKGDGTLSVGTGKKIRLLQMNAGSSQVTVVTDVDLEEKKRSVHKRLGPYAKQARSEYHDEDKPSKSHRLSRTILVNSHETVTKIQPKKHEDGRSSSESSSSSRHRSSSSTKQNRHNRQRKCVHNSGKSSQT